MAQLTGADLRAFLLADPAIAAAVAARIYPGKAPQHWNAAKTGPAIVYQRISGATDYDLYGDTGRESPRYQIDAYAATSAASESLAVSIRTRLSGYAGPMGGSTAGPVIRDNADGPTWDDDSDAWRFRQDFFIGNR